MKLINNQDSKLIDELKSVLNADSQVYFALDYISINGFFELHDKLKTVASIKILLNNNIDKDIRFAYDATESISYFDLKSKHKADTVYKLVKEKCQVRHGNAGGQKFVLVKNPDKTSCFSIVPQDINTTSLGLKLSATPIIMTAFEDIGDQYIKLFDTFWNISYKDLKDDLLNAIGAASKYYSPDYIYKYTLYNLFQNNALNEETENRINKIGFKQTLIWKMLFNFQKDAVLGAIDKIETFGGCIIADSVGLGKTFEALAIMKYYQMRNDRVLVLCPKKLRENWLVYAQNDKLNILSADRFNFDVLNHTDLSRKTGTSGHINLATINWGNYDLVVIDESHNFRNNNPSRNSITRYQRLMNDIIKTGVKTKVLMLSATPVNTRMNDIKNQIHFITEQVDTAFAAHGITSIEQTLKKAQTKFTYWLRTNALTPNSRESLINSLDGSYFKLLDLLTIARSRKHITKYYDVNDIGQFPTRLDPINIHSDFDKNGVFRSMDRVNDELNALNLGFYSPLSYVRDDKKASYETKYDFTTSSGSIFKQIERESSLIHLMRVNLLKRLESSIHSFRLTLQELLKQIDSMLEKIANASRTDFFDDELDINSIEVDDEDLDDLMAGGKVKVLLQDMDLIRCREDLLDDKKRLENLLHQAAVIDVSRDAKLNDLKNLIENKIRNNINPNNKKVIIFSAFTDTVKYLYAELADWLKDSHGLYSALVMGGDTNKTNLEHCKTDLNSILINFSPISKKRDVVLTKAKHEIDILFCSDCISEGQNLQDCDFLVNYDIHWNPVRIIQRFGRIDRIGSKNDKIQLVNFFPNLALDTYIDLIGRVKGRMQILDVSATGDDNIIEEDSTQHHDLEYRKRQLLQLQNKVLDLEDIDGGISITDLTFNDFKIDVDRLTTEEKDRFNYTPKSIFGITESNLEDAPKGVIFCLKNLIEEENLNVAPSAIYPYNLCYINDDEEIFVTANNPKKCLDYYKKLCLGQTELMQPLISMFEKETNSNKNMGKYTALLQNVIHHIKGVEDEMGLNTLAFPNGTNLKKSAGHDSFEIVSYIIVK